MILSDKSVIDPCNLLNLGSNDENFFHESIVDTYIIEPEVLSSEKAIIKDMLDSMIHIIANGNVSINESNKESEQLLIITTIIISSLNVKNLKKYAQKKGGNIS